MRRGSPMQRGSPSHPGTRAQEHLEAFSRFVPRRGPPGRRGHTRPLVGRRGRAAAVIARARSKGRNRLHCRATGSTPMHGATCLCRHGLVRRPRRRESGSPSLARAKAPGHRMARGREAMRKQSHAEAFPGRRVVTLSFGVRSGCHDVRRVPPKQGSRGQALRSATLVIQTSASVCARSVRMAEAPMIVSRNQVSFAAIALGHATVPVVPGFAGSLQRPRTTIGP